MALNRDRHPSSTTPHFRYAHVKIQSVSHTHFHNDGRGENTTIGAEIDKLLNEEAAQGRFPNKISLEINPPEEPDAHIIED